MFDAMGCPMAPSPIKLILPVAMFSSDYGTKKYCRQFIVFHHAHASRAGECELCKNQDMQLPG
jgi:hypothetical protein